jgi:hypothetical protein
MSFKLRQLLQDKSYPDCLGVKLLCKTTNDPKTIKFGKIIQNQPSFYQRQKMHWITILTNLGEIREILYQNHAGRLSHQADKIHQIAITSFELQGIVPLQTKSKL